MIPVVTAKQMRLMDEEEIRTRTPSKELMLRAGRAVFSSHDYPGSTAIVCGKGNNAGDGYVLAWELRKVGKPCVVYLVEERFSDDGAYYYEKCIEAGVRIERFTEETRLTGFDTVVDCLFGTGFSGVPQGLYKRAIEAVNASGAFVLSVDINSGLNGTNGLGDVAVKSDRTVSVGTRKTGQYLNRAKDLIGDLVNADIGIQEKNISIFVAEDTDFADFVKPRKNDSNKGDYGYVGIMGGCVEYSGAVKLASLACAAMRAGCGVCRVIAEETIAPLVAEASLLNTVYPLRVPYEESDVGEAFGKLKTLAVGMGWGKDPARIELLRYALRQRDLPVVIDADGLNLVSERPELLSEKSARVIVTPHLGEMARLTRKSIEEIKADPVGVATEFSSRYGVVTVLKGPTTVVTDGEKTILVPTGCPGMATAGSGDVLSGVLVGVLGQNHSDFLLSVAYATYINGLAGESAQREYGDVSMTAKDTVTFLPRAVIYVRERCRIA